MPFASTQGSSGFRARWRLALFRAGPCIGRDCKNPLGLSSLQDEVRPSSRGGVLAERADRRPWRLRALLRPEPVPVPRREPARHARVHGRDDLLPQQRRRSHSVYHLHVDQSVSERHRAAGRQQPGVADRRGRHLALRRSVPGIGLRSPVLRRCPAGAAQRHVGVGRLSGQPVREAVRRRHELEHGQHQSAGSEAPVTRHGAAGTRAEPVLREPGLAPSAGRRRLRAGSSCARIRSSGMSSRTR
jgi:hypothetical protein